MTILESFSDDNWRRIGPVAREHIRESWEVIERFPPQDRVKLLACFYWANWCRGRGDQASGHETFWDMC